MGRSINKQGNLHRKLVLGSLEMSRSLDLPTRIFNIYLEVLTELRHIHLPSGESQQHITLGCILEVASSIAIIGGM